MEHCSSLFSSSFVRVGEVFCLLVCFFSVVAFIYFLQGRLQKGLLDELYHHCFRITCWLGCKISYKLLDYTFCGPLQITLLSTFLITNYMNPISF